MQKRKFSRKFKLEAVRLVATDRALRWNRRPVRCANGFGRRALIRSMPCLTMDSLSRSSSRSTDCAGKSRS